MFLWRNNTFNLKLKKFTYLDLFNINVSKVFLLTLTMWQIMKNLALSVYIFFIMVLSFLLKYIITGISRFSCVTYSITTDTYHAMGKFSRRQNRGYFHFSYKTEFDISCKLSPQEVSNPIF